MIIDAHNHIVLKNSPYYLPQEEYLKIMDETGVDKMVILGKDYGKLGDSMQSNLPDEETAAFVRAQPERFIGFTGVHPDREVKTNLERIDRAVNEFGLKGIKLNPHAGFYPNDEKLYPVYEKATELDIPVMFHAGVKSPTEGTRVKYCQPVYLDDVAVDFPDMTIIIAHAGYPWVEETIQVGLYAANVFVDISTLNQIEGALGCEIVLPTIRRLASSLGAQRILFGSDFTYNIEETIQTIKGADFLSERDKVNILGENARTLLKV